MKLVNFNNLEELLEWLFINIEYIPVDTDDVFISVNKIFKYKRVNWLIFN